MDNLNPEFLYPILSKQTDYLTELMTALSNHLRPAPYPYGLLTMRLLGKLGGRNRRFLREPLDVSFSAPIKGEGLFMSVPCSWSPNHEFIGSSEFAEDARDESDTKDGNANDEYRVPLPLERAVEVLRLVLQCFEDKKCLEENVSCPLLSS